MKQVYFATRVRGFFKHLFSNPELKYSFISSTSQYYEVNGWKRKLLSKVGKMKLFDSLGLIQVVNCENKPGDIYGSSNRFLNSDKPYFIYLENPTALYHYRLNRGKSKRGKRKINQNFKNDKLKAIVCMSYACYSTLEKLCGNYKGEKKVIYPYIPINKKVDKEIIHDKCIDVNLKLLFISQGNAFISKGALEVIAAFSEIRKKGYNNISLTIVTTINELDSNLFEQINSVEGISLLDFNLSNEEMEELYKSSSLLLHPTSHDSFALVVLEAIKSGLPIIGTCLYAIPEMVKNGVNGYLTTPKHWFFDENNLPNPTVWNNREATIFSKEISIELVEFLANKICDLNDNRELLERMSLESLRIASSSPFDEKTITKQWNDLIDQF